MMTFTTRTGRFHVVSHGNGWAYEITCQATGESFSVQDDAASQLQEDTADFANEDLLSQYLAAFNE
jgi:hypothetical protein